MARKIGYRGRAAQPLRREFAAAGSKKIWAGNREARTAGFAGGRHEGDASRIKRHWASYWLPRNA